MDPTWDELRNISEYDHLLTIYTYQYDGWHLRVERRDGADGIPWDDLQSLKNFVMGRSVLAVEFYPPQHQVSNEINARHLWVIDPELIGFGRSIGFAR
jgi:YD repeat-containing protein